MYRWCCIIIVWWRWLMVVVLMVMWWRFATATVCIQATWWELIGAQRWCMIRLNFQRAVGQIGGRCARTRLFLLQITVLGQWRKRLFDELRRGCRRWIQTRRRTDSKLLTYRIRWWCGQRRRCGTNVRCKDYTFRTVGRLVGAFIGKCALVVFICRITAIFDRIIAFRFFDFGIWQWCGQWGGWWNATFHRIGTCRNKIIRLNSFSVRIHRWTCFRILLPDPEPEFVDVELLPGEGVAGSCDRPGTVESAETANGWSYINSTKRNVNFWNM